MSKKNKTSTKPWKAAQPYILGGAQSLQSAYDSNAGKIQGYTDNAVGTLQPWLTDRIENGDAGVNAARDYGVDVLSGSYLDGNPYLDDVISRSNNDIINQKQAYLGLRGLSGGSDYADIITDSIAENTLGLRFNDYNNERSRMDAAAGRAGSIAAADYLPVAGLLDTVNTSTVPLQAASSYAGGLGGLLGGYGTTTQNRAQVRRWAGFWGRA